MSSRLIRWDDDEDDDVSDDSSEEIDDKHKPVDDGGDLLPLGHHEPGCLDVLATRVWIQLLLCKKKEHQN